MYILQHFYKKTILTVEVAMKFLNTTGYHLNVYGVCYKFSLLR